MDHRGSMDSLGYDLSQFVPQQPPQIFGAYNADGTPIPPTLPPGTYFGDLTDGAVDENDPKRRRIARVRSLTLILERRHSSNAACRLVICAGRRRSSATGKCPNVAIVSTIKPSVSSPKSRRSAILPRGEYTGLLGYGAVTRD